MAQPVALPLWDTTQANVSAPTGGHKSNGYANSEIPTSGELNSWMNNVYLWFVWLLATLTIVRTKFPTPIVATNWATAATFNGVATPGLASSGAGSASVDLDIPQGYKLSTLTLMCMGNAAANLTIGIDKALNASSANTSLGALILNALSATPADQTLNMLAASTTNAGGQTVTVSLGGNAVYTRSAGSYITDGFFIGQVVIWTGFVNGGNNTVMTISALSATVMTGNLTTQVVETSAANATQANGVSPTIDSTFALQLKLTASATALQVKSLRYTCVPV
jgi:hypothetical protein